MKTNQNKSWKKRLKRKPRNGHSEQPQEIIFNNGAEHFTQFIKDINAATRSIDLETYIFQKDILGNKVVEALTAAAKRGVRVRILVDGAGSPYWCTHYAKLLENAGAKARVFHPFPWQLWNWSRSVIKAPTMLKGIYLFLKSNYRNHRKVCMIDNQIAFIGSLNITKAHLPKEQGGGGWRDTSIRLTDLDLTPLHKAFESAWSHRTIKERLRDIFKQIRRDPVIRLNYSRHHRRILYKHLLRKISHCQHRIWITNAYFVPDNFLLRRVKEAARNGVDVRILLPKKSDVMMMPWASSTFYYSLLKAGVRIFEYLPSNLHAKSLILDNWVLLGSSNLNHRSLLHDLEVDVNVRSPESIKKLTLQFQVDLENARELSLKTWKAHRPWVQRVLGRMLLYLKYWI